MYEGGHYYAFFLNKVIVRKTNRPCSQFFVYSKLLKEQKKSDLIVGVSLKNYFFIFV